MPTRAALLLAALLCAPPAPYAAPARAAALRIASLNEGLYDFPIVYAQREGYFSAAGLSLERLQAARGVVALLVSGQADLTIGSVAPALSAYQNGADLKILAFLYPQFNYCAVSRFKPQESSKIKTLALNSSGLAPELMVKPFLDLWKLDRKSLKTVVAPGDASRYALLERGDADLTHVSSPEILEKIRAEKKYTLLPIAAAGAATEPLVITASDKALRERGPELDKFIAALYRAIKAAAVDKARTAGLLKSAYNYPPAEAALFSEEFAAAARDMRYVPDAPRLEAFLLTLKEIEPDLKLGRPPAGMVYADYAKKAVAPDSR